jgi:hypothetical protein
MIDTYLSFDFLLARSILKYKVKKYWFLPSSVDPEVACHFYNFSTFSLERTGVISARRLEKTFTWLRVIIAGLSVIGTKSSCENFVNN